MDSHTVIKPHPDAYCCNMLMISPMCVLGRIQNQQLALIHNWLVEHRIRLQLNIQDCMLPMWFHVGRHKLWHPYPHVSGLYVERQTYLGLNLMLTCHVTLRFPVCVKLKMSYYLYLIKTHCKVLKYHIMKLMIEILHGVFPFDLYKCVCLGIIT